MSKVRTSMTGGMFLCLLLLLPFPALAVSTLSITPAGNGAFLLQGAGLTNVAGIDVAISYDSTTLSNPRLTQGSLTLGAMTAVNGNVAGTLRVSIIGNHAINGSGNIATISFDRTGDPPGRITNLNGSIIDMLGKSLPLSVAIGNPSDTVAATDPGAGGSPTPTAEEAAAHPPAEQPGTADPAAPRVVGGTVTLGGEEPERQNQAKDEAKEPVAQPDSGGSPETKKSEPTAPAGSDPVEALVGAPEKTGQKPLQSVLERFRTFAGARTVGSLTALFAQNEDASCKQRPPVLISDGKATVTVTIPKVSGDKAPNFAFSAARAISVQVAADSWLVEARPDKDANAASIIMLLGSAMREIPLTVAPSANVDLDRSGKVTEADFRLFLRQRGTANAPKYDMNGDGRRDYLDDYIFTANYLLTAAKPSKGK